MHTHLVLLRGINVSGQKIIKMEDLRNLLTEAGFENVQTYIQSGNIFVDTPEANPEKIEQQITALLLEKYNFQVPVVAVSEESLLQIFHNNPYLNEFAMPVKQLYVAFLATEPLPENESKLDPNFVQPDTFRFSEDRRALYLCYENPAGNSKMNNNWIENKLKVTATSRNWNTVTKLIGLFEARKN
ncbi:DUF1697 domain-containing protein [Flavobacterium cerinum]|uniref:DUF1697 domain-containing protein n=1 Tax=Flavobacterium cerinum TaxID=2502784 RepID=A0ABY5IT06_9FLAO|nr:DUF1697 domain-containing protein [Flavobacterium cerinum]UUC45410.1 DUF1697 domain-containing protein [Flavobacterium cerinum]